MRILAILLVLLVPSGVSAAPFFIEEVYATDAPPKRSSSSSKAPVIIEKPSTMEVPVISPPPKSFATSASSVTSAPSTSQASEPPVQPPKLPPPSTQELDQLTLEQLEEYANEAAQNLEEQLTELAEGFSVTGTSTLGSPLPTNQRSAILRSNVQTVSQLKLFAKALVESNENIRKITVEDGSISVTQRQSARLFWVIPVTYLETTKVEFDGSVEVEDPWWLFLTHHTKNTPDAEPIDAESQGGVVQSIAELLKELIE